MKSSLLGVAVMAAFLTVPGSAVAAVPLPNGSFEQGVFTAAPFDELHAGSTALTGWAIEGGSVDAIGSYWSASDGSRSLDLNGSEAGAISQPLATLTGATYVVRFDLSGNPAAGPDVKTLTVGSTGASVEPLSFDTRAAGATLTDMKWSLREYVFIATGSTTVLTFSSTTPGPFGPALDDVRVTEILPPEPSPSREPSPSPSPSSTPAPSPSREPSPSPSPSFTPAPTASPTQPAGGEVAQIVDQCKDGAWASVIDGHGHPFKNQGDCVSYIASVGKNVAATARPKRGDHAGRQAAELVSDTR